MSSLIARALIIQKEEKCVRGSMKCTNANKYTTFAHGKKNLKLESSELIFRANSGEHYV